MPNLNKVVVMKKYIPVLIIAAIGVLALRFPAEAKDNSFALVSNGRAAVIVLPQKPSDVESYAAAEMARLLKIKTGIQFPVVTEGSETSGNCIYLGATGKAASNGCFAVQNGAMVIQRKENNLFILGKDDTGLLRKDLERSKEDLSSTVYDSSKGTLDGACFFLQNFCGVKPDLNSAKTPLQNFCVEIKNVNRIPAASPSLVFYGGAVACRLMPVLEQTAGIVSVPSVRNAAGDPKKVEWNRAQRISPWFSIYGNHVRDGIETLVAHDAGFLYLRLSCLKDFPGMPITDAAFNANEWEMFFSKNRGLPYRQMQLWYNGAYKYYHIGSEVGQWNPNAKFAVERLPERCSVLVAFPLNTLLPMPIKKGDKFCANFYYYSSADRGMYALRPNYALNFHILFNMACFQLQ
jgi:hypothetical protein